MIVDWVFEIIVGKIFREINNKEIKIRTDTIGDMLLCSISPNNVFYASKLQDVKEGLLFQNIPQSKVSPLLTQITYC